MAKKLDPKIADILKAYDFGAEACWDCHGTWVVYHKVLEQIAAKAGVTYDQPAFVEADGQNKIATIWVQGHLNDKTEWSMGEAAPGNNKNAYPWAMAEKRAKDRVILKLIGLHGFVYSEEEADDFKASRPEDKPPQSGAFTKTAAQKQMGELSGMIHDDDATPDEDTLDLHIQAHQPLLDQVGRDWPDWINGREGDQDFVGFTERVENRREVLQQRAADGMTRAA